MLALSVCTLWCLRITNVRGICTSSKSYNKLWKKNYDSIVCRSQKTWFNLAFYTAHNILFRANQMKRKNMISTFTKVTCFVDLYGHGVVWRRWAYPENPGGERIRRTRVQVLLLAINIDGFVLGGPRSNSSMLCKLTPGLPPTSWELKCVSIDLYLFPCQHYPRLAQQCQTHW